MTTPTTTEFYYFPKNTGIADLTRSKGSVSQPGPTEVLLKIHATSVNFRDVAIAKDAYPLGYKKDCIPCSDCAGEIIAVGSAVLKGQWKTGDKVCVNFCTDHIFGDSNEQINNTALGGAIDGVLTQYINVPAHSLIAIPKGWTYEEASTLPCAAVTAYNALMGPKPVKAGDIVLVQGTGGVSIFALQFALAAGATVVATSSSDEKLQIAKKLGATHLINYKKTPDWGNEALRLTDGRGVDHVIEVGGAGTLEKSFDALRWGGWIHTIGFVTGGNTPGDVLSRLLSKQVTLRAILIGSVTLFEDMVRSIDANSIKPVVDKIFPFGQAKEAFEYVESQKHVGKVVIKISA